MTPGEWVALAVGVCAISTSLLVVLRFLIKSYLVELKPNSGSSMKDQLTRLEQRVDDLYSLIVKRQ
jgi:hypothetical protein